MANKNYLKYIATREGVALDDPENIDELLNLSGMESVSMDDGLIHEKASNDSYLRYIACRPRSHGLFGNIDTSDLNSVMNKVSEISQQSRVVYRGVISLSEKDAEMLGFKNSASWNQYLRKVMPEIARELGISMTNHTWVAAFHAEKSHPHVHYELWDNEDKVKSPFIHVSTQKRCREILSKEMFDNEYENMIKQVYQEELEGLKKIRNVERSLVLKKTENIISDSVYTPGIVYEVLPERTSHNEIKVVKNEVNRLAEMMKSIEHGRIAYKLLPKEMKEQVDRIAELLYKRPDVQCSLERYVNAVGTMQKYYGKTNTEKEFSEAAARKDMHYRICNKILKVIKSNYDFSLKYFEEKHVSSIKNEVKNLDREKIKKPEEYLEREYSSAGSEKKNEMKVSKDHKVTDTFDINISYTLVKAVLEDMEKQSRIQESQSRHQNNIRSNSKQSMLEEYRKNKDSSREPE